MWGLDPDQALPSWLSASISGSTEPGDLGRILLAPGVEGPAPATSPFLGLALYSRGWFWSFWGALQPQEAGSECPSPKRNVTQKLGCVHSTAGLKARAHSPLPGSQRGNQDSSSEVKGELPFQTPKEGLCSRCRCCWASGSSSQQVAGAGGRALGQSRGTSPLHPPLLSPLAALMKLWDSWLSVLQGNQDFGLSSSYVTYLPQEVTQHWG